MDVEYIIFIFIIQFLIGGRFIVEIYIYIYLFFFLHLVLHDIMAEGKIQKAKIPQLTDIYYELLIACSYNAGKAKSLDTPKKGLKVKARWPLNLSLVWQELHSICQSIAVSCLQFTGRLVLNLVLFSLLCFIFFGRIAADRGEIIPRENLAILAQWNVDPRGLAALEGMGFNYLYNLAVKVGRNQHVNSMIDAFVKHFDKKMCFKVQDQHLFFGLEDVLFISGLKVEGQLVTKGESSVCYIYLGFLWNYRMINLFGVSIHFQSRVWKPVFSRSGEQIKKYFLAWLSAIWFFSISMILLWFLGYKK